MQNYISKLKINKNNGIIAALIIIVVFAFYWFEWRPSQIKSSCYKDAVVKEGRLYGYEGNTFDEKYKNCLRSKGL